MDEQSVLHGKFFSQLSAKERECRNLRKELEKVKPVLKRLTFALREAREQRETCRSEEEVLALSYQEMRQLSKRSAELLEENLVLKRRLSALSAWIEERVKGEPERYKEVEEAYRELVEGRRSHHIGN